MRTLRPRPQKQSNLGKAFGGEDSIATAAPQRSPSQERPVSVGESVPPLPAGSADFPPAHKAASAPRKSVRHIDPPVHTPPAGIDSPNHLTDARSSADLHSALPLAPVKTAAAASPYFAAPAESTSLRGSDQPEILSP